MTPWLTPSMKISASPLELPAAKPTPTQSPTKVKLALLPATSERRAVPPLARLELMLFQVPVKMMAASVSSVRVMPLPL